MRWTAGEVIDVGDRTLGHGFSIVNQHRVPLLTLTYEAASEAKTARSLIEAVLAGVSEVTSYPDPSRFS
jgi:hypothetical protein